MQRIGGRFESWMMEAQEKRLRGEQDFAAGGHEAFAEFARVQQHATRPYLLGQKKTGLARPPLGTRFSIVGWLGGS